MVIDTSAIVAIALNEPDAAALEQRIADDPVRMISAATMLEAAMVIEARLGEAGGSELDLWLHKVGVEIVAVEAEHADQARRAWRRYGKGRHPAALNYGDCFSYALAALIGEPLLYKGNDFSQTDIRAA
ncbi:type II toxin-antitoxin system VapC family toxin [Neorhizobium galegae]|uniref:type II toxin-antitoxin system VapC family toxin n=1 Tax=Neorhizobium galegae TaxID=399 RepID=UPI001288D035|nr:type II toxin-antitoxin system VapC family toxin [Neorhizobium galegae]KAA9382425.1 type II toxin-antitoxin system VapC family toxin [Neorhizobium galegae]KAB1108671.1 type II toxin-antitoxin system VapC family toxin [Neorhizobium galegae]MCM2497882.1 type II toxin-antitoxin system VapC family toxin [Neorhizobium galegae]MCQ1775454.1 type II toxin-antitoxin system VapC family toxin [Neorhizobium galegae]MCQ1799614.1 type II toxin-antitoxin system VapC family toxin [Neorhizobium galegae]